ncbi:hypothetical protein XELAEV_18027369mg [Xenopus laevis]|uniref:Uncharacterized protein n=1 Tax=Xenopus laevis TaxID=8355 RepID=A0A974CVE0_XENLA|nr:hypothetical protein XELAEV_18027369mg [Xenopus laevis]
MKNDVLHHYMHIIIYILRSATSTDANDKTEDALTELDEDANLKEAIRRSMTEM